MPRLKAAAALVAVLLSTGTIAAPIAPVSLENRDSWTGARYAELEKLVGEDKQADNFIFATFRQAGKASLLGSEFPKPLILDRQFFDMNGDGKLHLLCRLDYSHRGFSYYLAAISPTSDGYKVTILDTHGSPLGPLKNIVKDINHDGRSEVIVDRLLDSGPDWSRPRSYFEDIYTLRPNGFIRDDHSFLSYYKQILLPKLQAELVTDEGDLASSKIKGPSVLKSDSQYQSELIAARQGSIDAIDEFLLN